MSTSEEIPDEVVVTQTEKERVIVVELRVAPSDMGKVIGSSQMYQSEDSRDNGIESVKRNAPDAEVVEEQE